VLFDWTDVSGASTYTIQVDDSDTFSGFVTRKSNDHQFTIQQQHSPNPDHVVARSSHWRVQPERTVVSRSPLRSKGLRIIEVRYAKNADRRHVPRLAVI
jgi:hypothetical protein